MQRYIQIGKLFLSLSLSLIAFSGVALPKAGQARAAVIKIPDLPLGKVISLNGHQFVKVNHDSLRRSQFIALNRYQQVFNYTGDAQAWIVPYTGTYKVELWGAQGPCLQPRPSYGGYVAGSIALNAGDTFYLYVGNKRMDFGPAFNGGGAGYAFYSPPNGAYVISGGGATDIRLIGGNWDDAVGLRSRVMVAAGSAGKQGMQSELAYGHAGGLIGAGSWINGGGTQVSGGASGGGNSTSGQFGIGGIGHTYSNGQLCNAGGGGGYYGGSGGYGIECGSGGGGGSSYISGHTGCVAITSATDQTPKAGCTTGTSDNTCSLHYSGNIFTNTVMIDGAGYAWTNVKGNQTPMPNPTGGNYSLGQGHSGNGVAKITLI